MSTDNRYLHLIRQDCPLPPGTHVVIYCRDSGGEEQDRSIAQQIDTAREYCQHHNLVLDHAYVDESKLSSNTDKRDQLQEMLFDLRRRFKHINDRYKREKATREKPFGIIFWKSNRLGRDSIEATNIKTDLRLRGITVIDLVTSANIVTSPLMRSSRLSSSGRMSRHSMKTRKTLNAVWHSLSARATTIWNSSNIIPTERALEHT